MAETNRTVTLARRPRGMARVADFAIADAPLPEPGAGEFRVRIACVSLDPAMRGWMNEGRSYVPPVALGAVMREDVREGGVDAFPEVLNLLYTGGNHAKLVLRV